MRLAALSIGALLAGCAHYQLEPITQNPKMQKVAVDGKVVMVAPYSDGTWGATTTEINWVAKNPAAERPRLIRAVEIVSGCKVTDANYHLDQDNLSAAVDCKRQP